MLPRVMRWLGSPDETAVDEEARTGAGLVVCLVKFSQHFERWPLVQNLMSPGKPQRNEEERLESAEEGSLLEKLREAPSAELAQSESWRNNRAAELYFSSAAEHLEGLQIPEAWQGTELGNTIVAFKAYVETMLPGKHKGYIGEDEVIHAHQLCQDIASMIDRALGLHPDLGNCW